MTVTPEFGFPLPSDQSRIVKFPSHLRTLSTTLEDKLPAAVTSAARAEVPAVVERYAADLRKSVDDAVARLDSFKGNGVETVFGTVTLDASGEPIREFFTTGATTFYANGTTTPVAAHTAVVWRRTGVGSWGYQEVPDEWTTPTPTPDTTAPVAGTLAVSVTDVKADLTVTGATDDRGVTGYAFQVNGGAWSSWQTGPTYTATGLTPSTAYQFRHKVRDAAGNETQGTVVSKETAAEVVAPPVRSEIEAAYLADSPVYYLTMQGETVTNMGSATGATFEVSGTTPTVAMPDGGTGRQFDGVTGLIQTTSGPSIGDTTSGFTMEATFVSPGGNGYLIGNTTGLATPQIGTTTVGVRINDGDTYVFASTPVDRVTHLVMTYDGQTVRRYENGVETHAQAAPGDFSGGTPIIGDRTSGSRRFVGVMRDVAVYASVLSPARVLAHAQAQKVA